MSISVKIVNPPKGINENQLFEDENHLNRWLQTHTEKLPNSRVENGILVYDEQTELETILPPESNSRKSKKTADIESVIKSAIVKNSVKKPTDFANPLSFWKKVCNFVRNLTHGKISTKP